MPNENDKFEHLTPKTKELDDAVFDLLFKQAAREHLEEQKTPYSTRAHLKNEVTFTPDFEAQTAERIKRWHPKKNKMSQFTNRLLKIAAVFLAVVLVSGMFIISSTAARVKVLNFFKSVTEVSTDIGIMDSSRIDDGNVIQIPQKAYHPDYLPKGFVPENVFETPAVTMLTYTDDKNRVLQISTYYSPATLTLNSENTVKATYYMGETLVTQLTTDNDTTLFFEIDEEIILLYGDIEIRELKKIAENLIK